MIRPYVIKLPGMNIMIHLNVWKWLGPLGLHLPGSLSVINKAQTFPRVAPQVAASALIVVISPWLQCTGGASGINSISIIMICLDACQICKMDKIRQATEMPDAMNVLWAVNESTSRSWSVKIHNKRGKLSTNEWISRMGQYSNRASQTTFYQRAW